jgi:penicillin-binding protein 2
VFDYLLTGTYPSEEDIAKTQLGQTYAPIGTPRRAADVPLPGQAATAPATPASAASATSADSAAGAASTPARGASR